MKKYLVNFLAVFVIAAISAGLNSCSDDDNPANPDKSSSKQIVSFKFEGFSPVIMGSIDQSLMTVTAEVPAGTDMTSLVPTIAISAKATIDPTSGEAQDFTQPVVYTVTAEDGSQAVYTVTVTEEQSTVNDPEELSGYISQNRILVNRNDGIDYRISDWIWVENNALLTIEAGVKIEFTSIHSGLSFGENAGLKVEGTIENPVIMTGPETNPNNGAWGGLEISSARADNIWEHLVIENAGLTDGQAVSLAGDASVKMRFCTIKGSLGYGINAYGGDIDEFKSCVIMECEKAPILFAHLNQVSALDMSSTFAYNGENYIEVFYQTYIEETTNINKINIPYLTRGFSVNNGTLNIEEGVTFLMEYYTEVRVEEGGKINADGKDGSPIIFTVMDEDKDPGYWFGIKIYNQFSNVLKNCVIEYGGAGDGGANLDLSEGKAELENVALKHSLAYGIIIDENSDITHSGVTFESCPEGNVYNWTTDETLDELP
ncbi:MAG: DUF5018 domain-containing protein [Candidatus Kapaibacterium sp.]